MCKLVKYAQVAVLYASSYVLVATAVDRYAAICHPMLSHAWTSVAARRLVIVAWAAALVLAVPQLVIFDQVELDPPGSGVHDCWDHFEPRWTLPLYITWFAVAVYVAPLAFLAIIYIRICTVVWHSATATAVIGPVPIGGGSICRPARQNDEANCQEPPSRRRALSDDDAGERLAEIVAADSIPPSNSSPPAMPLPPSDDDRGHDQGQAAVLLSMSHAKAKTVKLTLTVVVSYAICWGPFFVAQLWSAWDPLAPFEGKRILV